MRRRPRRSRRTELRRGLHGKVRIHARRELEGPPGPAPSIFKDGDKVYETFEEGSHLKESLYKITGGTGKYQGASGGGTYICESLTDTLCGGRYKGKLELP